MARDLNSADSRDLMYIDARGRVRKPGLMRGIGVAYWSVLIVLLGIVGFLGYDLFGALGLLVPLALTPLYAWRIGTHVSLTRATRAMAVGDYADADRRLETLAGWKLLPRGVRGSVLYRWASTKARLDEREEALALTRRAIAAFGSSRRSERILARYLEVRLLASLGRLEEARARFGELGECPEGELFRLAYWTTEHALAFREGAHAWDDAELHRRASFALGINVAAPLIGLLGWAFERNGDDEMAELMRTTALERDEDDSLARYPELCAWLDRTPGHDAQRNAEEPHELEVEAPRRARQSTASRSGRR